MTIAAAVKRAIEWGSDQHWKLELPEAEQEAAYKAEVGDGLCCPWRDAYLMECAEKYPEIRRLYQNMPVFDI